jgi:predicted Zn-dependent peptidase
MRSLAITPENVENQREVVKEERRLRIDNSPYGSSFLAISYEVPYSQSCYAYNHSVIGSMDDLNAAQIPDVQQFFDTYYAPNNAVLTVVGDFDPAQAKQLVEEYFGDIPAGPAPDPVQCSEPFSHLPVSRTIEDNNATVPAYFAAYGIPSVESPDQYPIALLAEALGSGESSRLYQRLVQQEKVATAVQSFADIRKGPGVFITFAIPNQGVTTDRIASLIDDEIARIRRDGITAAELEKVKNRYRAREVLGRQTVLGKAEALQSATYFAGGPEAINTELQKYLAVNRADLKRVADQYLTPQNRAVVITQPAGGQE